MRETKAWLRSSDFPEYLGIGKPARSVMNGDADIIIKAIDGDEVQFVLKDYFKEDKDLPIYIASRSRILIPVPVYIKSDVDECIKQLQIDSSKTP